MSKPRRTALMTLSPEQQAFLRHDTTLPEASAVEETAPENTRRSPEAEHLRFHPEPPMTRARSVRSVTLRLSPTVAKALREAAIRRSLDYEEPFTQQGIAECALCDWLDRHGYRLDY